MWNATCVVSMVEVRLTEDYRYKVVEPKTGIQLISKDGYDTLTGATNAAFMRGLDVHYNLWGTTPYQEH